MTDSPHCSHCQRTIGMLPGGRALPYEADGKGGYQCRDRGPCKRARWALDDQLTRLPTTTKDAR